MKVVLLLTTLLPLLESTPSFICHACFDHRCFTKRKLFESEQLSGQIAVDRMDNFLHLHYKDYRDTDHTVAIDLNYDDLRLRELPIQYSFARAINQRTGEVYFSGERGIYTYNAVTLQTEPFGLFRKQIWHMQFKNGVLYFSEYQRKGLYYVENNRTKCIAALSDYVIDDFIIDKHDDIYFISYFLVYRLKKDDTTAKLFSTVLYSLATDILDDFFYRQENKRGR